MDLNLAKDGLERAGFNKPCTRKVLTQQVGEYVVYMMTPPDGTEIISMNL